jgi:hypothetical protein
MHYAGECTNRCHFNICTSWFIFIGVLYTLSTADLQGHFFCTKQYYFSKALVPPAWNIFGILQFILEGSTSWDTIIYSVYASNVVLVAGYFSFPFSWSVHLPCPRAAEMLLKCTLGLLWPKSGTFELSNYLLFKQSWYPIFGEFVLSDSVTPN